MGCCCDDDPCVLCADNFDRGDSSDIDTGSSCGWTERSGAWEILSNRLRCTSSGVATCDTRQLGEQGNYISVTIWGDTAGDTAQVVVNLNQDAATPLDDYDYVEVTFSATVGQIRIMEIIGGGAPNQIAATSANLNIATSTDHQLLVCLRDGDIGAKLTHGATTTSLRADLDGDENTSVGLAASVSGNVEFNDWSFERNQTQNSGCNDCEISCVNSCTNCPGSISGDTWSVTLGFIDTEDGNPPAVDPLGTLQCTNCNILNGLFVLDQTTGCEFEYTRITNLPCKGVGTLSIRLRLDESPSGYANLYVSYPITDNRTCEVTYRGLVVGSCLYSPLFDVTAYLVFLADDGNCSSGCRHAFSSATIKSVGCAP